MKISKKLLLATSVSVLASFSLLNTAVSAQKKDSDAPLATPQGITIQPLGSGQGYSLNKETATKLPREEIAYTNSEGMTLYTYDRDPTGKSVCVDECARIWLPALAPARAKPVPGWSVIKRPEGGRQWALNGKPLYTYSEDIDVGSVAGNSPKAMARGKHIGTRGAVIGPLPEKKPMPEGWRVAMLYPVANVELPGGISAREVEDAMAILFVDEGSGKTLYAFDGNPNKAREACSSNSCRELWQPVVAPRLGRAKGDFGIGLRDDGIMQRTYKGKALFTYAGDFAFGDANGIGVDQRLQAATYVRYYVPPVITVQYNQLKGKVFATPEGKTLYRRQAYIHQSGGGHALRRGDTIRPAVGRDLGTNPRCKVDCEKWRPYLAPADTLPWGDWSVATRDDGSKQWVNRGYTLWTYDGDKAPGDINGNDQFQTVISHDNKTVVDIGTPYDGVWQMFWIAAHP